MANAINDRFPVTQKYLMTRGQAINFPSEFFKIKLKKNDVFGVVIDIPMSPQIITTMVCFLNGAANLYFNNGNEYSGASMKYRSLVQITNALVVNSANILPKCQKVKSYDLPTGRTHYIYLLTKGGIYRTELKPGIIPEEEKELRAFYVIYQRVLSELRNCQLKDEAERQKNA